MHTKFWWGKEEKGDRIEHLVVNRRTLLKQRLIKKFNGEIRVDSSGLGWRQVANGCAHGYRSGSSINH